MTKDNEVTKAWVVSPADQYGGFSVLDPITILEPYITGAPTIKAELRDGTVKNIKSNQVMFSLPFTYTVQLVGPWGGRAVVTPKVTCNTNSRQVVMSREVYNELIARASWDIAPGKHITRHIRKFNQHLKEEHRVKLAEELIKFKELKAKVYQIVNQYAGKYVFHKTGNGYIPLKLLGVGKDKIRLKCRNPNGKVLDYHVNQITVGDLKGLNNVPHSSSD